MASDKLQSVNELDFEQVVLRSNRTVLVDFTATWCGPCKRQAAVLAGLLAGAADFEVVSVDVDECPELTARYGVRGMPTLVAFQGGKETGRRLGLTNEQGVRALVRGSEPAPSVQPRV